MGGLLAGLSSSDSHGADSEACLVPAWGRAGECPAPRAPYLAFWTLWSPKHLTEALSPGGWCRGGCVPGGKSEQVSAPHCGPLLEAAPSHRTETWPPASPGGSPHLIGLRGPRPHWGAALGRVCTEYHLKRDEDKISRTHHTGQTLRESSSPAPFFQPIAPLPHPFPPLPSGPPAGRRKRAAVTPA